MYPTSDSIEFICAIQKTLMYVCMYVVCAGLRNFNSYRLLRIYLFRCFRVIH